MRGGEKGSGYGIVTTKKMVLRVGDGQDCARVAASMRRTRCNMNCNRWKSLQALQGKGDQSQVCREEKCRLEEYE